MYTGPPPIGIAFCLVRPYRGSSALRARRHSQATELHQVCGLACGQSYACEADEKAEEQRATGDGHRHSFRRVGESYHSALHVTGTALRLGGAHTHT